MEGTVPGPGKDPKWLPDYHHRDTAAFWWRGKLVRYEAGKPVVLTKEEFEELKAIRSGRA